MRKYTVEFIGTFFLVLAIGMAAGLKLTGPLPALTIGCTLIAVIYAGGHVSGAHYNPAVTLAMWMHRQCTTSEVPGYIAAQLIGSVLAAFASTYLVDIAPAVGDFQIGPMVLAEALFTFALCWVILNVALAKGTAGNSFYGLAIGFVVIGGILAVGPISGAVFNPAVAISLCVMGLSKWTSLWIYCAVQVVAAVVAAKFFEWVSAND